MQIGLVGRALRMPCQSPHPRYAKPAFASSCPLRAAPLHFPTKYNCCPMAAVKSETTISDSKVATRNPFGIHALVFSGTWSPEDARRAISGAATAGFDIIEIPMTGRRIDTALTKRLLKEYGITPTCSLGLTADTDISSENSGVVKRGEEVLELALETAAEIGSSFVGGVLYSMLGKYDQGPTERGLENSAKVLRRICERAAKLNIKIGLEPCNRYETNVVNTVKEMRNFIKRFGEPDNCFVHFDAYHVHIEENYEQAVEDGGDRIGYVHVGDSQRGYLGSGNVDFGRIFRSLAKVNYEGPLVFESFSKKVVDKELTRALAIWREMWSDSEDLAEKAHGFLVREWNRAVQDVKGASADKIPR